MIEGLRLGLRRDWRKFLVDSFLTYSVIWTVLESADQFFPGHIPAGWKYYTALTVLSLTLGTFRALPKRSVTMKVAGTATTVRVFFGDIFSQSGYLAIPVNEYFDSQIGDQVSGKSLHGSVIAKFGGAPGFDTALDRVLAGRPTTKVSRPKGGKSAKYPIGETVLLSTPQVESTSGYNFLLFVLCHSNIQTFEVFTDLPNLCRALEGLLNTARVTTSGGKLVLPLVGGGLARLGLPPDRLLQLIILVVTDVSKKKEVCKEIDIVLHEPYFAHIDLDAVSNYWT